MSEGPESPAKREFLKMVVKSGLVASGMVVEATAKPLQRLYRLFRSMQTKTQPKSLASPSPIDLSFVTQEAATPTTTVSNVGRAERLAYSRENLMKITDYDWPRQNLQFVQLHSSDRFTDYQKEPATLSGEKVKNEQAYWPVNYRIFVASEIVEQGLENPTEGELREVVLSVDEMGLWFWFPIDQGQPVKVTGTPVSVLPLSEDFWTK